MNKVTGQGNGQLKNTFDMPLIANRDPGHKAPKISNALPE